MRRARLLLFVAFALGLNLASIATAEVVGRVVSESGVAIPGARVFAAGAETHTGSQGEFRLEDAAPPVEVVATHPRFVAGTATAIAGSGVEIVLTVKQQVFEEIAVSARRTEQGFSPPSVAVEVLDPTEATAPPSTLTELVADVPGVAENGQGGIFQTYSIRGVARQRVLTLVSGMRILGERRAGVSASFLDPRLIGTVDVVRGPSSTYWGSGALGGVLQIEPRRFEGWSVESGWESQGNEAGLAVGWGDASTDAAFSHRSASGSETAAGEPLFSGFEQTAGLLRRSWEDRAGRDWEVTGLGAVSRDIEKASTDFPERETVYPEERHLLLRVAARRDERWSADAWIHPNELTTQVTDVGEERSELDNSALDLGFNLQRFVRSDAEVTGRWGLDWVGRRGVDAVESTTDLVASGAPTVQRTLSGAEEDELGLFGALEGGLGPVRWTAGGRFAWQRQSNDGSPSIDDTALLGFVGAVAPLGHGFELTGNLGTGLRFPSLSERFFTGITGRGEVEGNPALDPERSRSLDLGLRWYGRNAYASVSWFRNDIDDYIERVEVAPDRLTFVNLVSGTLEGFEWDGFVEPAPGWRLRFGGHRIDGDDATGGALADVPADRVFVGVDWKRSAWEAQTRLEARSAKTRVGSGEKPVGSAELLSASVRRRMPRGWTVGLSGRNLLDAEYFNSADRRVPPAAGRSLGLSLTWSGE